MGGREIKLSGTSYVVLGLLRYAGEATPYDLKQFLEKSVENFWPVPHTTFYAEPARLARAGYLAERQEEGGRRRKLYTVTEQGEAALDAWVNSSGSPPPQIRDDGILKIFMGADPRVVLQERREWHVAKIEELDGYLAGVTQAGGPEGVASALRAGLRYHRLMLEGIEEFLDGPSA